MIPHISIKVRRWLNSCIPAVLGHQNGSEQIVTPVRHQTSTLYSTQTVRFRTGVPSRSMISLLSSAQHTKLCLCFLGHSMCDMLKLYILNNLVIPIDETPNRDLAK